MADAKLAPWILDEHFAETPNRIGFILLAALT